MTSLIVGSSKQICTQKGLLRRNRRGESWRTIAAEYGVNQKYVYEFARYGTIPANLEVCYQMGLKRRPAPKVARQPSVLQVIIGQMASETRKVLKGWRPLTRFVKKL